MSNLSSQTDLIQIVVNGQEHAFAPGRSVKQILLELGLDPSRVAVELNRNIVRKADWESTPVESGAVLEVVQFVGGG